jgi:hypothetical protein
MKYDVVIKSHKKDYHKLELVVDSLRYLNPEPTNIYILSPDGFYPRDTIFDSKIIYITDQQVTPFIDRSRLTHRPNWNWINLVSFLQDFTENDYYLDVQSDNFFTKPIDLFDESGKPKIFQSTVNPGNNIGHRPYFNFQEKVFDIPKVSQGYSYIIEFLMYDKKILKEYINKKYSNFDDMMENIYINVNEQSYPADQELFGNLVEKYYPEKYIFVPNAPVHLDGVTNSDVSVEYLKEYIKMIKKEKPEVIACSHHTWI